MRPSHFEIIVLTLATIISLLIIFLPLAPVCATIAPPCQPNYFQERLPLVASSVFIAIIYSIALSIITINRIRKEIEAFNGWRKLILKTFLSWITATAFTGVLIATFWNKTAAIYALFSGPPLAIILSARFLAKNKALLFAIYSITTLIGILAFILLVVTIIATLSPWAI